MWPIQILQSEKFYEEGVRQFLKFFSDAIFEFFGLFT